MEYIRLFDTLRMSDVPKVGGKNAALGEMIGALSKKGIEVPDGFAITADAYWYYLTYNNLRNRLHTIMATLDSRQIKSVQRVGKTIRELIIHGDMPPDLAEQITSAYRRLSKQYNTKECAVAVRSSATAEDLRGASFAGQQETYLNISGNNALLHACKKSMASLFTDRAIIYRIEKKFDHFDVGLSIGVQKMIRSDKGASGVAFSLDTESGFKDVVMIDASWGLGESIVQGMVSPDEIYVFKPTLAKGFAAIIKKQCGTKKTKIVYSTSLKIRSNK